MVNFNFAHGDIIEDIVDRFVVMCDARGISCDITQLTMDLYAANGSNGNAPIDLDALLKADDVDFVPDVAGIRNHINRQPGVIEDCFLPRFAKVAA